MSTLEGVFSFIASGSMALLFTIVFIFISFVIGVIVGYLARKVLKIAIIAGAILLVICYLGFFGLSLNSLKTAITIYGPTVIHIGALLIGVLPIGLAFVVGLIIGFIFT
ncbi:MAG: hypothetical protein FWH37_04705 [Candidatus Bathyarchaeota archaeon]|nr:hypothetical protein [Candidatus Termiticorpusculum sp.]